MSTETMPYIQYWLIRVGDGENLRNSVYPFWGVKQSFKGHVKKFRHGDILLFITSKQGDESGKVIAMGEYTEYYDRNEEPLLQIHTKQMRNKIGKAIKIGRFKFIIKICILLRDKT